MKRLALLFAALAIAAMPVVAAAQHPSVTAVPDARTPVEYSTATQVTTTATTVNFFKAKSDGTNACTCSLYDSAAGATTTLRNYAAVSAGNYEPNGDLFPVRFLTGLYAVPSGTGCSCLVGW